MSNNTLTMEQKQRGKWIDEYNNSLPQKKWFDTEFDEEVSVAIGGIYDGEAELYEFDNVPSPRILFVLQLQEQNGRLVSGIKCRKCGVYLEPHTQDEHLDINHKVHKCEGGHRR
jgi:hypothetical protein